MRVLHCIWRMNMGGAERQLVHLSSALIRRNVDVHVVTVHPGENDTPLAESGATIHHLASLAKYDPLLVPRTAALIRRLRPDVVSTWLTQMDIIGGLAAAVIGVPRVLNERCSGEAYPPSLLHYVRARIGAGSQAIVANSKGGGDYWLPYLEDEGRMHVIQNIVPKDEIDAAPRHVDGIGEEVPVVLFVGRFSAEKNLERLIDALAIALQRRPMKAVFCGDGPLRPAIEARALQLGIADRLLFLGIVTNVWGWMKRAAALVAVSVSEGDPNAVLEGIACGTPLVLSDIPAHASLVGVDAAWFVDPSSSVSIASGIVSAIADETEGRVRARRARATIESRSAAEIAARHEEVYRGIIKTIVGRSN